MRIPDGRKVRIFGTPKAEGLPETRVGAEEAERRAITRVLETGEAKQPATRTEVPTVREFHEVFLAPSRIINKPSSVQSKEKLFRTHILPRLGDKEEWIRGSGPGRNGPTDREAANAAKIRAVFPNDRLLLVPKLR